MNESELHPEVIKRVKEELDPVAVEELYDEMLDCDTDVRIGTLRYATSQTLAAVDPVAYRSGLVDYVDGLERDGEVVEIGADDYYRVEEVEQIVEEWEALQEEEE